MAEEKRLIGNDGSLARITWGTTVATDLAAKTWCKIVTKASSGSKFGNLSVGDYYFNTTAAAMTMAAGDTYQAATITQMLDINGWMLKLTGAEVDVTVLNDKYRKYRKGKLDAEGSVSFVYIKGISDAVGGIANYFFDIANIDDAGVVTLSPKLTTPMYLLGYTAQETETGMVAEATILQVEFFDFALNVKDNEASNQEPKFRLAGDSDPILYRLELA